MKIRVHPGLCEGHGQCWRFAWTVYRPDADGHVDLHLLEVPPELEDVARLGAEICPEGAITVIESPPLAGRSAATGDPTGATPPTAGASRPAVGGPPHAGSPEAVAVVVAAPARPSSGPGPVGR